MQLSVVFLAVLAASWVQAGAVANRCDPKIIALIKAYNEKVPEHIMLTNVKRSPDFVAYTTLGLFSNEEDICSISATWFSDGKFNTTFVYKNKAIEPKIVEDGPLEEYNGITYDRDTMTLRYHVYTKGLVAALYKCHENGKEGSPEALVKVWKGYKKRDLKEVKENMEMLLGCRLSVKYDTP